MNFSHTADKAGGRAMRRQTEVQRMATAAILGVLLTAIAMVLRGIGLYQMLYSASVPQIKDLSNEDEVAETLGLFLSSLGEAVTFLAYGNTVLFVGGCFIAHALRADGFRKRWFFWIVLFFSLFFIWQPFWGSVFGAWWACLLFANSSEFFVKPAILISE